MYKKQIVRFLAVGALFVFFTAGQAFAQAGTGTITGAVSDSTGAIVPNATVKYVNKNTAAGKTVIASADGIYTFILLQPGLYTVTASAGSFADQSLDVGVQVGRTTTANFALGVGDVSAIVTVSAEGIQTTEGKPDAILSDTAISNLPINGRRFQDFATLTPTAQIDPQRGQISLSGQRGINTNVNVDGVDYNQPFFGGIRGGERSNSAFTLPQESIREFQVIASGYGAEFGRSSGGIINVVTKSGGNDVRGSAFYLLRPKGAARGHEYANAIVAGLPQSVESVLAPTQHQFGGSIGGPIVKDKIFYFGAYEQQRFRAPRQVFYSNAADVNPATLTPAQLAVYNVFKGLEVPFTQTNDVNSAVGKIDWNVNDANRFNVRFNWSKNNALNAVTTGETSVDPTVNKSLLTNGTEGSKNYAVVSQLVSSFSPNVINDFRFQWAREERPRLSNSFVPLVANTYGDIGTRSFLPTTQFDTRFQVTDAITVIKGNHNVKIGGEFSRLFASQLFGFNQPGNFNYFNNDDAAFLNVLSNVPRTGFFGRFDDQSATYRLQVGNLEAAYKVFETSFYGQDVFRVTPNVTVTLGLRAEKQFNPSPQLGNDALINAVKNGKFPSLSGKGFDPSVIPDSEWQFGPRFGVAWDPWGDGKTVVRANAGMYYARTPLLLLADAFNNFRTTPGNLTVQIGGNGIIPSGFNQAMFDAMNPQYVAIVGTGQRPNTVFRQFAILGINLNSSPLTNLPIITPTQLSNITSALFGASTGAPAALGIFQNAQPTVISPDFQNPRSLQFGLGIERQLTRSFSVGLDYAQVDTDRLQRNRDINLPAPILLSLALDPAQRPYIGVFRGRGLPSSVAIRPRPVTSLGSVTVRESTARSFFQALTLRARYVSKRFQLNTYYVFAKSQSDDDNERSSGGFDHDNSYNLIPEYGPSRLDVRHRFTANPVVFIPGGIEVSSAIRLRSGRPVDAVIGNDLNGDGNSFADRPFSAPGIPFSRNSFRGNNEFEMDVRIQKSFKFGERKSLSFSAELFNVLNRANIDISGATTRYCSNTSDRSCGLNGVTNSNFLQTRNSSGNIITFANFAGSQVFQAQFGVRFNF